MTPCRGETSEICTRWGILKIFIVRGVVLNLTMIVFYGPTTLWKRIGRGLLVKKNKINCQKCNINVAIVDFLRHGKFAVRGVVLNLTTMISNEFCCQKFIINLTESTGDCKIWFVRDLILT